LTNREDYGNIEFPRRYGYKNLSGERENQRLYGLTAEGMNIIRGD
jgi:hypothetical protein